MRVPLSEVVFEGTSPVRTASGKEVYVYQRGTTTKATLYASESGEATLAQPLTTDAGGRPERNGAMPWVEPGSYDLAIAGTTSPWEAVRGDASDDTASALESALEAEAYISYLDKADGSNPSTLDSGQSIFVSKAGAEPEIKGGVLTTTFQKPTSAAIYFSSQLRSKVRRMGAVFRLVGPVNNRPFLALVPWTSKFQGTAGNSSQCHVTVGAVSWEVQIWENGTPRQIASQFYGGLGSMAEVIAKGKNLPCDGTLLRAEWFIKGETVEIRLPNGEEKSVSDPAIASIAGTWAVPELYFNASEAETAKIEVLKWWADGGQQEPLSVAPTRRELALGLDSVQPAVALYGPEAPANVVAPKNALANIHTSNGFVEVTVPASGTVLFVISAFYVTTTACTLFIGVSNGTTTVGPNVIAIEGTAYKGNLTVRKLVTGLTPGTTKFWAQHFLTGTENTATCVLYKNNPLTISATPLP